MAGWDYAYVGMGSRRDYAHVMSEKVQKQYLNLTLSALYVQLFHFNKLSNSSTSTCFLVLFRRTSQYTCLTTEVQLFDLMGCQIRLFASGFISVWDTRTPYFVVIISNAFQHLRSS